MSEQSWLKYGILAIAVVGMLAIVAFAMNRGEGLEDRTWVVQEMSIDGTMTTPIVQATPYAIFDNGGIGGSAGCNTYNGGYEAGSGSITIGPLVTTLMFCEAPQGTMEQESAYLALLQSADSFEVDGDQLTFSIGDSAVIRYSEAVVELRSS